MERIVILADNVLFLISVEAALEEIYEAVDREVVAAYRN